MQNRLHFATFATLFIFGITTVGLAQEHSVLSNGTWFKIPISSSSVYQITTEDISALAGVSCNQIALYGAPGGMMPTSNRPGIERELSPIAVDIIDANENGIFDERDKIVFFAEGPNNWKYKESGQRYEYESHAYANNTYIFLTTTSDRPMESMRISDSSFTADNAPDITTYTAVTTYHQDNINTHGGGQIWVADKFTNSLSSRSYTLNLPSTPNEGSLQIRYAFAHISEYSANLSFVLNGETKTKNISSYNTYMTYTESYPNIHTQNLSFTIKYSPNDFSASGYLDFIEASALVPLTYTGQPLYIRNQQQIASGNKRRFVVNGDSQSLQIWDVNNPTQPYRVSIEATNNNRFSFVAPTDMARTFIAFNPANIQHPTGIIRVENQDIHGTPTPEYVIVAHGDYTSQAEDLADLHRLNEGMDVAVYSQEQVFNEYSSGSTDPMAIRMMLRDMRNRDPQHVNPKYLLLFGKGTYDNRDIMDAHQSTVVTYQTPTSFDDDGGAYPSDDIYGYLDSTSVSAFDGNMSVSIGRLPAKNAAEATLMVNKIAGYMNRRDFDMDNVRGDWRNYVCLLADDADPSNPYDTNFASDSEIMARRIKHQYPHINIDRIYADSYTQQSGADGSFYPEVNNALRQRINYGCLLLNYIGHGSSSYIGTERYMEFPDIEKYSNIDRLTFFVTSTCSFGHYDLVGDVCGAEQFVLAQAAGVGIISAARPIHHTQQFNTAVCINALNPQNTIGDALRMAKNSYSVSHCITLLGDPALHLSIPRNQVVVTKINGHPVDSAVTDSLQVLSRVTVEGEIRKPNGELYEQFDGTIFPIVFDRETPCRTLANDNDSTEVDFVQQKNMLYKGREIVEGGRFCYSFIIPRDVAYNYDYAKLSHYARSDNDNATGQYSNIMFGGFNDSVEIVEQHPIVQLFIGDTNFRDGGITHESPTLYARLFDKVGINAAGSGLGHDITATIDNNPYSTVTLNDYFEPSITDSRNGEIYYTLEKLNDGPHTLTLKCWNIFNYSGSSTIHFNVVNDKSAQIGHCEATPNPAHDRTSLRIEHNIPTGISSASIDIYDIRGGLIMQFQPTPIEGSCVIGCPWDFKTCNGTLVPKGIYIMKATIFTQSGQYITQTAKIVKQ